MDAQVLQGQALDKFKETDTKDSWYIVFQVEEEEVTYGPFLTQQDAKDDMPRVLGLYTSLRAIG